MKIAELSGRKATVYTVFLSELGKTTFELFLEENLILFKSELFFIRDRLKIIGKETGALEYFFKDHEGNPGDGICALYDDPDKRLRLYCIRYGTGIVIIGSGGEKPKDIRALQENEKLKSENYFLRAISTKLSQKIKEKDLRFSDNGLEFIGEFDLNDDE